MIGGAADGLAAGVTRYRLGKRSHICTNFAEGRGRRAIGGPRWLMMEVSARTSAAGGDTRPASLFFLFFGQSVVVASFSGRGTRLAMVTYLRPGIPAPIGGMASGSEISSRNLAKLDQHRKD